MLCKVAVTGALSCGKSSTCRFFKELGAYVVSADEIVHQLLLSPKTSLGQQIVTLLGEDIVVDGRINRSAIAKKVFNDQQLLQSLEKLLHPAVLHEIDRQYQQVNDRGNFALFIAEIPLLFEINSEKRFDYTIAVEAPEELCRQRFTAATGYGNDEFDKRMSRQLPSATKAQRADFVIQNNGSMEQMHHAVDHLYNKLISSTNR